MKIMKVRVALATGLLLGFVACLSVVQAQVYLPGIPGTQAPANNIDPDFFNAITDSGSSNRAFSQFNCGDNINPCVGGLMHRFDDPRVEAREGGDWLVFDWQIKAAQPPETTEIGELLTEGKLANLFSRTRLNLYFNTAAFGTGTGRSPTDWGPGCVVDEGAAITALRNPLLSGTAAAFYVQTGSAQDGLQLQLANTANIIEVLLPTLIDDLTKVIIPHDRYLQMAEIACPIVTGGGGQPAKVAFQGLMMSEDTQRIKNPLAASSAALDIQRYVTIATNNLWYYPLDGAPAIIDAELGAGGPGLVYLDLTFSEEVVATSGGDEGGCFRDRFQCHHHQYGWHG